MPLIITALALLPYHFLRNKNKKIQLNVDFPAASHSHRKLDFTLYLDFLLHTNTRIKIDTDLAWMMTCNKVFESSSLFYFHQNSPYRAPTAPIHISIKFCFIHFHFRHLIFSISSEFSFFFCDLLWYPHWLLKSY